MNTDTSSSSLSNHMAMIAEDGTLLIWGWNMRGQLGLGHKRNMATPQVLVLPDESQISGFAAGI